MSLELPQHNRQRASGSFLALVAALILVLLAVGIFRFHSIAMVSPTDGWAVGNSVLPPNADGVTFGIVLHYTLLLFP